MQAPLGRSWLVHRDKNLVTTSTVEHPVCQASVPTVTKALVSPCWTSTPPHTFQRDGKVSSQRAQSGDGNRVCVSRGGLPLRGLSEGSMLSRRMFLFSPRLSNSVFQSLASLLFLMFTRIKSESENVLCFASGSPHWDTKMSVLDSAVSVFILRLGWSY